MWTLPSGSARLADVGGTGEALEISQVRPARAMAKTVAELWGFRIRKGPGTALGTRCQLNWPGKKTT